jgi:lipopolysaccharide assembly protein A
MRVLKITFWLLLSLLIIAFALLNASTVHFNYILGRMDMPLSFAMLMSLILGAFLGMLWTSVWVVAQRTQVHALNKKVNLLQKEIDNLRAMPVKDVKQWS